MSTVSALINKNPILPIIDIVKNDATTYSFNPFTSTFDFRLREFSIDPPHDAIGGDFTMTFIGSGGTIAGTNTLIGNIGKGNEVVVWLGKSDGTKKKIFRGVIETYKFVMLNKNDYHVTISGPDWGSDILKSRIVNGQWVQNRLSSGEVDTSDNSTTVQEIVLNLLQREQSYPFFFNGQAITAEDQGVIVDAANILPINLQVALFNANMEFLDDKLQELDDIGGSTHYIDPDKNFHMKQSFLATADLPSGILLTDDNNDSVGLTWDATKIGLIEPPLEYIDTLEHHKRVIYGVGGDNDSEDQSQQTTTSNTQLDTNWIAQRFRPDRNNVSRLVLWLSKIGTPPEDFVMELREDKDGKPLGSVLRTILKNKAFLDTTGTTATPITFDLNEELDALDDYWIVVRKTGDASNTYRWHRDATDYDPTVTPFRASATSTDDITWTLTTTPNRFGYAFLQFYSTPVLAVLSDGNPGTSSKHLHEDVIKKADISDIKILRFLLVSESARLFKQKETIKASVYAPDTLLQTGMMVRVRLQQVGKTVDGNFVIGKVSYTFEGTETGATGNLSYEIEATRFEPFA